MEPSVGGAQAEFLLPMQNRLDAQAFSHAGARPAKHPKLKRKTSFPSVKKRGKKPKPPHHPAAAPWTDEAIKEHNL